MRRRLLLGATALLVSVLPPLLAVCSYFPVWREAGAGTVLSGFAALLLVMTLAPLLKALARVLSSPSVWGMWVISFILFFTLSRIADEMVVISLVGAISNLIGAIIFRAARRAGDDG